MLYIISVFLSQWIATINNISKRIYLSENPEVSVNFFLLSGLISHSLSLLCHVFFEILKNVEMCVRKPPLVWINLLWKPSRHLLRSNSATRASDQTRESLNSFTSLEIIPLSFSSFSFICKVKVDPEQLGRAVSAPLGLNHRRCPLSLWTRWWPPTRPSSLTSSHPSARNTRVRPRAALRAGKVF